MKRIYLYILALLALSVSCQRIELPEEAPTVEPGFAIGSKAEITFSTAELYNADTKALIDPSVDINTLHLVIFDEEGMLVEVCEATKLGSSDHGDHTSGRHYTVTITVTDKPRIIHFVANCPVNQIVFGHETSIIGNMYVDKNVGEFKTPYETSYWARIEVPYILVEEHTNEQGNKVTALHNTIIEKFRHVPLLRNYAEITVTNNANSDSFKFEGYTVYNIFDRGTVAPYNSNTANDNPPKYFQDFYYKDGENVVSYSYPEITGEPHNYEGHALQSAQLLTEFPRDSQGNIQTFASNEPFYLYERRISVVTDEEDKWKESPVHIIIKGQYKAEGSNTWETYYYKMDLVYKIKDPVTGIETDIKYYHILRNFIYQFNLTAVHAEGYKTLEEAVAGSAGNNISGSASASKLTNVSDNVGRLWVSYTDTTLVSNDAISLKYKYIPNYYDSSNLDTYEVVQNDLVTIEDLENIEDWEVITNISGYNVAANDITTGPWAGYRNVIISVKDPGNQIKQQTLSLKTNSANLNRDVRYTLRQKFNLQVECTQKVAENMLEPVTAKIKLPVGLTEDMFPLVLNIETFHRTLTPDVANNEISIPVTTGPSIIDVPGRKGVDSYYYTVTIPTIADYRNMDDEGSWKVFTTEWLTNKAANASTIYVDNKYFTQASDSWENYTKTFGGVSISNTEIPYGVGREVSVSFTMSNTDNTPVTLTMTGLQENSMIITPTAGSDPNVTVKTNGGNKTVTVSGLYTNSVSDPVSVNINADGYKDEDLSATRITNQFIVTGTGYGFTPSVITGDDDLRNIPVEFTFEVPVYYENMVIDVELDGLAPADEETRLIELNGRSAIKTYTFTPGAADTYKFQLKTINKDPSTCSLKLEAEAYYYESATSELVQGHTVYEFNMITCPTAVAQGEGKNVEIEFALDSEDESAAGKSVNVSLIGMKYNDEYETTLEADENGRVKFTAETTSDNEPLKLTIEASGYLPYEKTIDRISSITIPKDHLETNIRRNEGFANNGTIYIYTNQNYTGTYVSYSYDRSDYDSGWNTYKNGTAKNSQPITFTDVNEGDTLYIKYVNGRRTYTGTFELINDINQTYTLILNEQ